MVYPVTFKSRKRKRHIQYSLENNNLPKYFQPREVLGKKCKIYLKNKFKKYKKRHLIVEDADIISISNQLGQKLRVRSPRKENPHLKKGDYKHVEDYVRPRNYLFKMGKHKKKPLKSDSNNEMKTSEKNKVCDQDTKKHTNAFQVMMGSRNKSIGRNSPGKDINNEEIIPEETLQKRREKIKRKLVLQDMANAKGALEKQAKERYQDKIIKRKLQKRADLLKDMLLKTKTIDKQNCKNIKNCESVKVTSPISNGEDIDSKNKKNPVQSSIKIYEIPESDSNSENYTKEYDKSKSQQTKTDTKTKLKLINKEDEEFLTRLSSSIKKKENMLCYFKKIDKSEASTTIIDDCDDDPDIFDKKIKVKTRFKKKNKIKISSLAENEDDIPLQQLFKKDAAQSKTITIVKCCGNDKSVTNKDIINRKRKYKEKKNDKTKVTEITNLSDSKDSPINENNRPKRNIKRPVKYNEKLDLSSSDDEFSIVSPKKRKHTQKENVNHKELNLKKKNKLESKHIKSNITDVNNKTKSANKKKSVAKCKPEKLAPIFKSKSAVDLAALEAKQKFLQSGIPDQLKKIVTQKKVQQIITEDLFIPTVHINHSTDEKYPDILPYINLEDECNDVQCKYDDLSLNKYFKHISKESNEHKSSVLIPVDSIHQTLDAIKQDYPEFPVYRTYKNLKNKMKGNKHIPVTELNSSNDTTHDLDEDLQEDPNSLPWVDKYKALSSKEIIGNFDSMKEIKKWLVTWKENNMSAKKQSKEDSDFSDFYDSDSRESYRMSDNLMIVTGPTGCGKTTGVYAVAAELSIKVIEVNVSSKRTGKIMLQDLHEATQSHKVNRGTNSKENSQTFLGELKTNKKKKGRPSKINCSSSQVEDATNTKQAGMSLILIDDADIVFEQDDGFTSAVSQLVQLSKRPVIVVTTSLTSQHLQRFSHCKTIIKLKALSPKMLGTWLDIMCLADCSICQPGTGTKLLEYFNGDIRKCINYLQYIICSSKTESSVFDTPDSEESCTLLDIQDETSNQSWVTTNTENFCDDIQSQNKDKPATTSIDFLKIEKKNMFDIITVWWNIPKQISSKCINVTESGISQVENILVLCDTISFADSIMGGKRGTNSISSNPWQVFETDSVSEIETLTEYNRSIEYLQEISRCLIETSLMKCGSNLDILNNLEVPGKSDKRCYEKAISGHTTLTESLNLSSVLDRRSMALDYWPTFRTICRSERVKTDSKRNNRFTHYLKSTKMSKSTVFERLSTSLES